MGPCTDIESKYTPRACLIFSGSMALLLIAIVVVAFYIPDPHGEYHIESDVATVCATIEMYDITNPDDVNTLVWDYIQTRLGCCGVNSPDDWKNSSTRKIPRTCCEKPVKSYLPPFEYCMESDIDRGCYKTIINLFHESLRSLRTFLCILIVLGMCGAAYMYSHHHLA